MRTDFAGLRPEWTPLPAPERVPPAPFEGIERIPPPAMLAGLLLLALLCAGIVRFGIDDMLAEEPSPVIGVLVAGLAVGWILAAPFVCWIAALLRSPLALAALKGHAAIPASFQVTFIVQHHMGWAAWHDGIITAILLTPIVGAELLILAAAEGSVNRRLGRAPRPRFLLCGLVVAAACGAVLGTLAWSAAIPSRIVAAAEAAASGAPHCLILRSSRPATRRDELAALRLGGGGVLLIIEDAAGDRHLYWSFRQSGFRETSMSADEILALRRRVPCAPVPHFSRDLS